MRFTEHELTAALTGAATSVLSRQRGKVRKGQDAAEVWEAMDRYERFKILDAIGGQVLPVLVALPDVEVAAGARPSYSEREVGQVVAGLVGEDVGRLKRAVLVRTRTALVLLALAHVPLRLDPDALLHGSAEDEGDGR